LLLFIDQYISRFHVILIFPLIWKIPLGDLHQLEEGGYQDTEESNPDSPMPMKINEIRVYHDEAEEISDGRLSEYSMTQFGHI
jgi:hypothetical protein